MFISSFRSAERRLHFLLQLFLREVSSSDTGYTPAFFVLKKDTRFINVKQEWSFLGSSTSKFTVESNGSQYMWNSSTCNFSIEPSPLGTMSLRYWTFWFLKKKGWGVGEIVSVWVCYMWIRRKSVLHCYRGLQTTHWNIPPAWELTRLMEQLCMKSSLVFVVLVGWFIIYLAFLLVHVEASGEMWKFLNVLK